MLILAAAAGLAWLTGELTSSANEAAGGNGDGVRIISVPLIIVGVIKLGLGVFRLAKGSDSGS